MLSLAKSQRMENPSYPKIQYVVACMRMPPTAYMFEYVILSWWACWEGLRGVASLEKVCNEAGLEADSVPFPVSSWPLSLDVSSQLFLPASLCSTVMDCKALEP